MIDPSDLRLRQFVSAGRIVIGEVGDETVIAPTRPFDSDEIGLDPEEEIAIAFERARSITRSIEEGLTIQ